jgi:uncharacterized metal-binding protein YceD (DUF177 family)
MTIFFKIKRFYFALIHILSTFARSYYQRKMSKFEQYNIVLKDLNNETKTLEYALDNEFFNKIDSPEVHRGNVSAKVVIQKKLTAFELNFTLEGIIYIPCNRCLDDMEQLIQHKEKLQVKFGENFSEENEMVIVPEREGSINIAWFLYEFIVVSIPIKHTHPTGECNKTMVSKLKKHIIRQKDDETEDDDLMMDDDDDFSNEDTQIDPRWDNLQNIVDNN